MIGTIEKRSSNFELLRVISMLFIIGHHFVIHGLGNISGSELLGIRRFVIPFLGSGGKLGVVLFSMITGYFMIRKDISVKRIIGLELQVLFYSIFIYLFFVLIGWMPLSGMDMVKYMFPTCFKVYWFFSSYFFLYLLIPYLNKLLLSLKKKEFLRLIGICGFFLILVPSILIYNETISSGCYLIFYYLVGAYVRLFMTEVKGKYKYLFGFLIFYLMIILAVIGMDRLSNYNVGLKAYTYYFSGISSILVGGSAFCLFLFFKNIKIKSSAIMNGLGSVSFGVYLFHDHPVMRLFLWSNVLKVNVLLVSSSFVVGVFLMIMGIYLFGGILELVRKILFQIFDKCILNRIKYFS